MDGLSRQGWLVAGGGAVCAAAFAAVLYQAGVFGVLRGAAPAAPQAPVQAPDQSPAQSPAQTPASPQAAAPQPALAAPGFDIARVEPNGDAVIAGRAAPGAQVTLMISGKPGGQAQADANGQFVILPKALPPGAHELSLRARTPQGEIASNQSIAVLVPQRPSGEVVVALAEPGKPTAVLSNPPAAQKPAPEATTAVAAPHASTPSASAPSASAPPAQPAVAAAPAPAVHIQIVEADEKGGFYASGSGTPGGLVRLYLNNAFIAEVRAGADGLWSLRVARGLTRGKYSVRADAADPVSGKVAARAEVEFDYAPAIASAAPAPPSRVEAAPAKPEEAKPASPVEAKPAQAQPAPVVVLTPVQPANTVEPAKSGETRAAAAQPSRTVAAAPVAVTAAAPPAVASAPQPAEPAQQPAQTPVQTPNQAPAHAVIEQIRTASVVRGDSLWRISRKMLGQGVRYTQIYAANSAQIRNPHRIYPGQVLVVPQAPAAPAPNRGG